MSCNPVPFKPRLRRTIWIEIGATMLFSVLTGACSEHSVERPADILVVDVLSVARALGRDEAIQQKLQNAKDLLNQQLTAIEINLQQQLREEQSKLETSTKQNDSEKISELTQKTRLKLRQSQLLAKRKAEEYRTRLLLEFRGEVLAVSQEIAKTRRARSVQIANQDLLWVDPSIDITADVIKKLRAMRAKNQENPRLQSNSETSGGNDTAPEEATEVNKLNRLMNSIEQKDKQ